MFFKNLYRGVSPTTWDVNTLAPTGFFNALDPMQSLANVRFGGQIVATSGQLRTSEGCPHMDFAGCTSEFPEEFVPEAQR